MQITSYYTVLEMLTVVVVIIIVIVIVTIIIVIIIVVKIEVIVVEPQSRVQVMLAGRCLEHNSNLPQKNQCYKDAKPHSVTKTHKPLQVDDGRHERYHCVPERIV